MHGQSCLFVIGIDDKYLEGDIVDVFKEHGEVVKCILVPNESRKPKGRAIVQYKDERAIARIDPEFLSKPFSPDDVPSASWHITTIQDEIVQELEGQGTLDEKKFVAAVAGLSKTSLIQMLQTHLSILQMTDVYTAGEETPGSTVPESPQTPSCLDESLVIMIVIM